MSDPLLVTSRFTIEEVVTATPNGQLCKRPVLRHPGAVAIIPLVDHDHVCLIRNFRVSVQQTLIELPAGTMETHETPEQTALRELQEETGYRAGRIEKLHAFYLSPGVMDECMHLFVADQLEAVGPNREAAEQIENLILTWREASDLIRDGSIQDAKTIVGLMLYQQFRQG